MYLIGLAVQMYEAEDLKTRFQQQQQQPQQPQQQQQQLQQADVQLNSSRSRRRRQTPYNGPRQVVSTQTNSERKAPRSGDNNTANEHLVTSTTDLRLPVVSKRPPNKMQSSSGSDKVSSQAAVKQPTLVELLQAGVERPPNGPPRLTSTPVQRSHQSDISGPGYSGLPSRLAEYSNPRLSSPTNDSCNRSCILQLLQCSPTTDRAYPSTSLNDETSSSSGPLIVEADSSNIPLDADLLSEMALFSDEAEGDTRSCPMCHTQCFTTDDMEKHLSTACMLVR